MSNESFKIKNGLTLTPVDLTTLTNIQAGDLACDINDSNKIKRYDTNTAGWTEVGAGGVGNVNALLTQTFDNAATSQFTQTGLALVSTNTISGALSAQLIHQAASSQSFKQVIAVDRKYRGDLMAMSLQVRSSATSGNLTLLVTDETNSAVIMASSSISTGQYQVATAVTNTTTTISGFSNVDINLLKVGMTVTGSGIPTATVISSINTSTNTIVISQAATASATITAKFSALPDRKSFSFTIPTNCASLSYTVTALQEAGLPESYVDDVVIELANVSLLETSVTVPNLTAWQSFVPTGTWTSNITYAGKYRQSGENLEIQYFATLSGAPNAVGLYFNLPSGFTMDTSKVMSTTTNAAFFGSGSARRASNNAYYGLSVNIANTTTFGAYYMVNGTIPPTGTSPSDQLAEIGSTAPFAWATGDTISVTVCVPCAGLSASSSTSIPLTQSGLVQDADSSIMAVGAVSFGSTNTTVVNFPTIRTSIGSNIVYSSSSTAGTSFTVLKTGTYSISAFLGSAVSATTQDVGITKNSPSLSSAVSGIADEYILTFGRDTVNTASVTTKVPTVSWTGILQANDVIRIQGTAATTPNSGSCTVTYQGSLKQVSVNTNSKITIPTSELRFEGASARGSTDTAIVKFDTQAKIRGDAFSVVNTAANGTVITMTKKGNLSVNANLLTGSAFDFYISLNQTTLTSALPATSEILASGTPFTSGARGNISWNGFVNVGDIIRVSSGVVPSANLTNMLLLAFQEQEIQVSVSNTLPQFSESDTYLRIQGGNGYGSSATTTRRFASIIQNIGSDIEYTDSATLGGQFVAKSAGIYNINYSDTNTTTADSVINIAINGSVISQDRNGAEAGEWTASTSSSPYLNVGDIITLLQNAAATSNAETYLTISKVGKPNVTGVNVTPFVNVPQSLPTIVFESQSGGAVSVPTGGALTPMLLGTSVIDTDGGKFSTTQWKVPRAGTYLISAAVASSAASGTKNSYIAVNGSTVAILAGAGVGSYSGMYGSHALTLAVGDLVSIGGVNQSGTTENWTLPYICITSTLQKSDTILTVPETFSTDTAALTYASSAAYTLATLNTAPVGTFITFTYAINTNTRTQTTTAPTQTTADMNANGIAIYPRAYNVASTAALPSFVAIQIGKGLKGLNLNVFKSIGKTTNGSLDVYLPNSAVQYGLSFKDYNELTGILLLDAGVSEGTVTSRSFFFSDISAQAGYLVVNASKNPALTGMNLNRIAVSAGNTSSQVIPASGVGTTMLFDAVKTFDTHGALNAATGVFTAPETGYYQLNAQIAVAVVASTYMNILIDGASKLIFGAPSGAYCRGSGVFFMSKNSTLSITLSKDAAGTAALIPNAGYNNMSISKVSV